MFWTALVVRRNSGTQWWPEGALFAQISKVDSAICCKSHLGKIERIPCRACAAGLLRFSQNHSCATNAVAVALMVAELFFPLGQKGEDEEVAVALLVAAVALLVASAPVQAARARHGVSRTGMFQGISNCVNVAIVQEAHHVTASRISWDTCCAVAVLSHFFLMQPWPDVINRIITT